MLKYLLPLLVIVPTAHAYQIEVNAKAAMLYHPQTGKVLYEKNPQTLHGPASLTKLMTLALLFEALEDGRLTLQSQLPISEKAWRKGGSKMFLEVGKTAQVEDLIRGITVSSGNDACIVIAEYLAGTEDGFTAQMNAKAEELGLKNTNFMNSTGWPDPKQYSTAEDMVKLATHLRQTYPQYMPYFTENSFTYSDIAQSNRNGLLRQNVGVDGMKTGHTEDSGYHLLATAREGDTRLISIVLGTEGFAAREGENLKLLRYGFTQHENITLWRANTDVLEIPVWLGTTPTVTVMTTQAATTFANKRAEQPENITISYLTPLPAPITAGQQVGEIQTTFDGQTFTTPLVAAYSVAEASFMGSLLQRLFYRLGLE